MRGLDTPIKKIRKEIFREIARIAFESDQEHFKGEIEAIPYHIVEERAKYRDSIYRERAVASERVRLAMGMSLRPENRAVHITAGVDKSNIDEKYYEPPLMQVIPSACDACEPNSYMVSDMCRGCVAHPCRQVCPKGAIIVKKGKSIIDQEKCIRCGKCKQVCPYDAISRMERPCARACGVNAIDSDEQGRATINHKKCVSCGMCMVSCPFGAISDKSQIFQLCKALREEQFIVAEVAPAYIGQFGKNVTPEKLKAALLLLGFREVYEVALGADIGAVAEAHHYAQKVATGELPFLLTSCCPSWSLLAKKHFPDLVDSVSQELTPMVATARSIKQKHPDARVVFVGPCASKKLEASRRTVRSDVDFVITFEELVGMFEAKGIDLEEMEPSGGNFAMNDATAAGRGYAVAGGVAEAIRQCLEEYYPDVPVHIEHAEGLADCRKALMMAKAGKLNGCLIEGMGCPGGCMAGAGTNVSVKTAAGELKKLQAASTRKIPSRDLLELHLE
ncbi:4Fe-4S dicluster domain-containing protein [Ruminococcus sp. OA3]|uniref:4Fe-4S dicluster domain-containing protein n=1 Tax=Ruminococcus sp. OA3 TaxID=2914164 RepID=UPI001F060B0C|nr:4Fe-4S dicluster domain-containing protein [Ruminococcus sp. OA3]MCH1981679.1 4Fe-4S dicluster domain-containing protein [Ruminococcus sp. OA3]